MYIWRKVEVTVYRVHSYLCHIASAARWTRWLDLRESIQLYSTAWGSFLPGDSTLRIEDGSECFSPSTTSSLCSCKSAKHHIHVSKVQQLIQLYSSETFQPFAPISAWPTTKGTPTSASQTPRALLWLQILTCWPPQRWSWTTTTSTPPAPRPGQPCSLAGWK